jgi:hypothetical protein
MLQPFRYASVFTDYSRERGLSRNFPGRNRRFHSDGGNIGLFVSPIVLSVEYKLFLAQLNEDVASAPDISGRSSGDQYKFRGLNGIIDVAELKGYTSRPAVTAVKTVP